MECEVDFRIYQYYTLKSGEDIAKFGSVGLQKLAAGRHIIEKIVNLEIASHWAADRLLSFYF